MSKNMQNLLPLASLGILLSCWTLYRGQNGLISLLICLAFGIMLGRCLVAKNTLADELYGFTRTASVVLYLISALFLGFGHDTDSLNLALGGSIFLNVFLVLSFADQRQFISYTFMNALRRLPRLARLALSRKI